MILGKTYSQKNKKIKCYNCFDNCNKETSIYMMECDISCITKYGKVINIYM